MATNLIYFLYNRIPGLWTAWTLAVLAVGRADANAYMRAHHKGGKFVRAQDGGEITANCGAVTSAAQEVLKAKNEAAQDGY